MHWIQTVLCPQEGGTKVKLVNQVEGYHEGGFWEANAQRELHENAPQDN